MSLEDSWKQFSGDFDSMTDQEIEQELLDAQNTIDEQQNWVEAVALWKAAGKPRCEK